MSNYAQGTTVEVYASQLEVMKLLAKAGIKKHGFFNDENDSAAIVFERNSLSYRVSVDMPNASEEQFCYDGRGRKLSREQTAAKIEAETRRLWRCLVLIVKAKLVAIDDGVTTFEKEFMSYAVVDSKRVLADVLVPRMKEIAANGGSLMKALGDGR